MVLRPSRRMLLLLGILIGGLFFFIFFGIRSSSRLRRLSFSPTLAPLLADFVPRETNQSKRPANVVPAPIFEVNHYSIATSLPQPINASVIYTFKEYNRDIAIILGKKLVGENAVIRELDRELLLQDPTNPTRHYTIIDPLTGMFSYRSLDVTPVLPPLSSSNPAGIVARYLRTLDLIDETVGATAYYRRSDYPGEIFIEFHRLWEQKAPIVNAAGTLNASSLSDLSLTAVDAKQPQDLHIVVSSDDAIGRARNNQINTLTVGVSETGQLRSIFSTLRPIEKTQSYEDLGLKLLDPKEIEKELKNGGVFYSYLIPEQAKTSWATLFPENKAKIENAQVTSIVLAYSEKPLGVVERYLQPVYVVKGEGMLEDGTQVAFTQTIPALEPGKATNVNSQALAGMQNCKVGRIGCWQVFAQEPTGTKSIQIGTFEPTPKVKKTPTPKVTSFLSAITPTPPPRDLPQALTKKYSCLAVEESTGNTYKPTDEFFVEGLGTLVLFRNVPKINNRVFFLTPAPNLLVDNPGYQDTIDGIRISPPCMIMPVI